VFAQTSQSAPANPIHRRCASRPALASQWMAGSTRPWNVPRFCYYLDKALKLTDDEKAAVAAAVGRSEYPLSPRPSEERRVFWSSSTLAHHGKLL
jgi:hypothetical protein